MVSLKLIAAVIAGVVAAGVAVANRMWGPRARARKRLAGGLREIADGEIVTLVGNARAHADTLTAPLTGRACVAYEALARLYETHGSQRTLVKELVEVKLTPFELVTPDRVVIVEADRAAIALPTLPLIPRKIELEARFLRDRELDVAFVKHGSFEEVVVEDGDRIAVQGLAIVELVHDAADRGYRDAPQRVRLVGHAAHPLTIGKP